MVTKLVATAGFVRCVVQSFSLVDLRQNSAGRPVVNGHTGNVVPKAQRLDVLPQFGPDGVGSKPRLWSRQNNV
jgi:hypothetical protein